MSSTSRELLDAAYSRLGFSEGDLVDAGDRPSDSTRTSWVEKGDWLTLAKKVGAEKVFFVNNYPVIVFAQQTSDAAGAWMQLFNSVWCMARPQLLFLAKDGELSIFNLGVRPASGSDDQHRNERLLDAVRATADVQDRLYRFRRDQIESGRLFEDRRFGSEGRADRALIHDLGKVRQGLIKAGLSATYAHKVIGRSIFIRYLEDRRVLTEKYFRMVAKGDANTWTKLLDEGDAAGSTTSAGRVYYPCVLNNKAFAYALFAKLSRDFNGDIFPVDSEEQDVVTEKHLRLVRRFLLGNLDGDLFFFPYRFDIIPIELISSIYEEFYSAKPGEQREEGSYYTPASLVDFVLSEALGSEQLAKRPRVIDPACGSGIFLVEAFRRLVRHRVATSRRRLRPDELHAILRDQIAGIDINPEAIRVAAFSLCLAMLHYLEPPDILHRKLPCLTYTTRARTDTKKHFNILVAGDAFKIKDVVQEAEVRSRFTSACADVIVGNPPWGSPKAKELEESKSDGGVAWCEAQQLAVGDKERSQSFIHRSMDLLREGGRAGLLVSTGVFFKRHNNTRRFRDQWLTGSTLRMVVNFAAVRDTFFRTEGGGKEQDGKGAIAPFAVVIFDKSKPQLNSVFGYWSAKETAFVRHVQAVVLNRADFCYAVQAEFLQDETLWKVCWWGNHRDRALIQRLRLEKSFRQVVDPEGTRMCQGFKEATRDNPSAWLLGFKEFPTRAFDRYGPLPVGSFQDPPDHVHRRAQRSIYEGPRLLIKRGIDQGSGSGGRIAARFELRPFCFRNSIWCVPVDHLPETDAKIILGILWSSLTRYFLFLTSGTWGLWHDEVREETLYQLPVRFPRRASLRNRITRTVDALRTLPLSVEQNLLSPCVGLSSGERTAAIGQLEAQLDKAVFDLFELNDEERERITELCGLGLDFYYRGMESDAVQPVLWPDSVKRFGYLLDSDCLAKNGNQLGRYLSTFLNLWEPHLLDQSGCLRWRVIRPSEASPMLAAIFQTENKGESPASPSTSDEGEWHTVLSRIESNSPQPAQARRLYIDGLIRLVSDSEIVIIKRNERRLWTASAARDDAEATMLMAMQISIANSKDKR